MKCTWRQHCLPLQHQNWTNVIYFWSFEANDITATCWKVSSCTVDKANISRNLRNSVTGIWSQFNLRKKKLSNWIPWQIFFQNLPDMFSMSISRKQWYLKEKLSLCLPWKLWREIETMFVYFLESVLGRLQIVSISRSAKLS